MYSMKDAYSVEENGVQVMYRYKYLPFSEGSLRMITEGTLKFTCPLEFNDPFDCMPSFDPASIEEICQTRPDLVMQVAAYRGITYEQMLEKADELKNNVRLGVESGDFLRGLVSAMGIVSLSRNPTNILMWSHYASHHQGFVVELRIPMDAPRELLHEIVPMPVTYSAIRPIVSWAVGFEVTSYFLTKSEDWAYEEEERVIATDQGPGIHAYSREHFLWSVVAGPKMSEENYSQLNEAVQQAALKVGREITVYRAKMAAHKYKVLIPGHPNAEFNTE